MTSNKLSLSSYLFIGSMLFGLFFGAGNLIFPVHMGQEAGSNILPAIIGFLITGVGLPFLGVLALGISQSPNLYDLSSRISPLYAIFLTTALSLTIGPIFALPRTGSVSYEIGLAPYIAANNQTLALLIFTLLFFTTTFLLSLKPGKILLCVGKVLNPLFLFFLTILIIIAFYHPMGDGIFPPPQSTFVTASFSRGFIEGYNTMDALASLLFGVIVIDTLRQLGLKTPREIAVGTFKSGIVAVILMSIIYTCLSYIGVFSANQFAISSNGGIALAQIANYYLGSTGSILLAIIVTLACLKTAVGLTTACSNMFCKMFPGSLSYKNYVLLFTVISFMVSNLGLTQIINLAIPILMFLYPLCITLILLALLSPLFKNNRAVYVSTTAFTVLAAFGDALNNTPDIIKSFPVIQNVLASYHSVLPFFDIGMGWTIPAIIGFIIGCIFSLKK